MLVVVSHEKLTESAFVRTILTTLLLWPAMTAKRFIPPILPDTFEALVAPWLKAIAHKDIVAVMSYPASDRQRRMLQLIDDIHLQKKYLGDPNRYVWVFVDFRVDPIDDTSDLERHIRKTIAEQGKLRFEEEESFEHAIRRFEKHRHQKVVLVCIGCETLLHKQQTSILIWFTVQSRVDRIRMLLFFEANLFSEHALALLSHAPAFQPRICTLALYKELDVRQFLMYLEDKWSVRIPSEMKDNIVATCGGAFLLVKEAVRHVRDHPNASATDVFNHVEMQFNLALLWNGFSRDEQQVFDAILTQSDIKSAHAASVRYLARTGLIEKKGVRFVCIVPLLLDYRRAMIFLQHQLNLGSHGGIQLDGTNISSHFSRAQRRMLTCLIEKQSTLVSRDEVAAALWPVDTEKKYSDWALDSHVSRLRTKLLQLNISERSIRTVKGKGFIFNPKETNI